VFILALIALILGACFLVGGFLLDEGGAVGFGALAIIAAFVLGTVACMSIVPTRNVGIVTSWGKPTGRTTGAGLQWSAPWQDIDDWDASGQTYAHLGDQCVWVTVTGPRTVCIPVQVEWQADPAQAPENWAAFKEADGKTRFETWVARRIDPQMTAAIISTFSTFDPFASVNKDTGDVAVPNLNASYRTPLLDALKKDLGGQIAVRSIAFGRPVYDDATTKALGDYSKKTLERRNLDVDKANADIRQQITNKNAAVNQTARCLEIAEANGKEPGLCMAGITLTHPVD
jgi:hypothetical protein